MNYLVLRGRLIRMTCAIFILHTMLQQDIFIQRNQFYSVSCNVRVNLLIIILKGNK